MARRVASRRRPGHVDMGASWISYSDMMAALLLVFVLVLCYSIYQYFAMLETKTAELTAKETQLSEQQSTLDTQASQLLSQQGALQNALTAIESQKGQLTDQEQTLSQQAAIILAAQQELKTKQDALTTAQTELQTKETALSTAQATLADQQIKLDAATSLVQTQQTALDTQQKKLDDLVGVRTKIIRDLSDALTKAKIKATVDKNTGDIMLESTVFFDVGKFDIKDTGKKFLNQFVPLYLSVLLKDEYSDYLGEIIIEGHTDTQGTYLSNLELSQDRALSVATYCLQMQGLSGKQQEKLRQVLTAKGRSYSDPVYNADGSVNMDASRRVEFKFRLKDSEMIDEMRQILTTGDQ